MYLWLYNILRIVDIWCSRQITNKHLEMFSSFCWYIFCINICVKYKLITSWCVLFPQLHWLHYGWLFSNRFQKLAWLHWQSDCSQLLTEIMSDEYRYQYEQWIFEGLLPKFLERLHKILTKTRFFNSTTLSNYTQNNISTWVVYRREI